MEKTNLYFFNNQDKFYDYRKFLFNILLDIQINKKNLFELDKIDISLYKKYELFSKFNLENKWYLFKNKNINEFTYHIHNENLQKIKILLSENNTKFEEIYKTIMISHILNNFIIPKKRK